MIWTDNSGSAVMCVTEISPFRARKASCACFSTVINRRAPFCYLLLMMNTNGRIVCIVLFVSMLSIGVLALAAAVDDTAITAEDSAVTIAVLFNDGISGLISLSITSGPNFGTAVVNLDGASGFSVGREGQRRYSLRHERQRLVRTDSGD